MMEQMRQMSEEFKRKKMVDMISQDDFNQLKQVLDSMGQTSKAGDSQANFARQMMGALAMKNNSKATGNVPTVTQDIQIDPLVQKNRLIIQMRTSLCKKYQVIETQFW